MSVLCKSPISKFSAQLPAPPQSEISNFKSEIPSPPSTLSPKSGKFWENVSNLRSFKLTELQLLALDHTLRGVNDSRIAEILGITRRTLWNWKTFNEDYRRALAEGRAALHAAVVDRLQAASAKSLDALDDLLDDCDPKTRLHAAQTTLRRRRPQTQTSRTSIPHPSIPPRRNRHRAPR